MSISAEDEERVRAFIIALSDLIEEGGYDAQTHTAEEDRIYTDGKCILIRKNAERAG